VSDQPEAVPHLPIFPLGTVLFPGGRLPLRVFETRYMDMVRSCMRDSSAFGVCRITEGGEVGQPAQHETIGCLARIADWDMTQPGVLQIRVLGDRRFRIVERSVQKDGLISAHVVLIADDALLPVPKELDPCASLLRKILIDLESKEANADERLIASPYEFDSCAWVSNRLCELLYIPISAKQKLMALDDPIARLTLVHQFLQQRKVI
jgi:uncharacterized protein